MDTKELRDSFAAAALAGGLQQDAMDDMSVGTGRAIWWYSGEEIAKRAYEIADAMMRVRRSSRG